jgi:hypothetical protein
LTIAGSQKEADVIRRLAGLVVRYGKKDPSGIDEAEVMIDKGDVHEQGIFAPLTDEQFDQWRI